MKIFFSQEQLRHDSGEEFASGVIRPTMESPARAGAILRALAANHLGVVETPPEAVSEEVLHAVHDPRFVAFLRSLHREWSAAYPEGWPFPEMGIPPGMRRLLPQSLRGQLAYYCFDTGTAVRAGTWEAIEASIATAAAGANAISAGHPVAFSLCRPPGHHAGRDFYGGYCFLNNAAVAAETWVQNTGERCAILDIDFHHGNGTQQIFYEREEVFYASLHGSPAFEYPFFSGYEDETGAGPGLGKNLNLPLAKGTTWTEYRAALGRALEAIVHTKPGCIIVSLGADICAGDPVGDLGVKVENFARIGSAIREAGVPVLAVMEGGYAVEKIGECVASFLTGLKGSLVG